jgi:hypothetical protein
MIIKKILTWGLAIVIMLIVSFLIATAVQVYVEGVLI